VPSAGLEDAQGQVLPVRGLPAVPQADKSSAQQGVAHRAAVRAAVREANNAGDIGAAAHTHVQAEGRLQGKNIDRVQLPPPHLRQEDQQVHGVRRAARGRRGPVERGHQPRGGQGAGGPERGDQGAEEVQGERGGRHTHGRVAGGKKTLR